MLVGRAFALADFGKALLPGSAIAVALAGSRSLANRSTSSASAYVVAWAVWVVFATFGDGCRNTVALMTSGSRHALTCGLTLGLVQGAVPDQAGGEWSLSTVGVTEAFRLWVAAPLDAVLIGWTFFGLLAWLSRSNLSGCLGWQGVASRLLFSLGFQSWLYACFLSGFCGKLTGRFFFHVRLWLKPAVRWYL